MKLNKRNITSYCNFDILESKVLGLNDKIYAYGLMCLYIYVMEVGGFYGFKMPSTGPI